MRLNRKMGLDIFGIVVGHMYFSIPFRYEKVFFLRHGNTLNVERITMGKTIKTTTTRILFHCYILKSYISRYTTFQLSTVPIVFGSSLSLLFVFCFVLFF